jgi:hypothetical protein
MFLKLSDYMTCGDFGAALYSLPLSVCYFGITREPDERCGNAEVDASQGHPV